MSVQKLWYLKQAGGVRGPFPAKVITQYLLLGRITENDVVSLDTIAWLPIHEFTELLPINVPLPEGLEDDQEAQQWREERLNAAKRWADERGSKERRTQQDNSFDDVTRRRQERRQMGIDTNISMLRQLHAEHEQLLKRKKERFFGLAMIIVFFIAIMIAAGLVLAPINPVKVDIDAGIALCKQPAKPQINWVGCDKRGAWLRGVDLASANLAKARFNSAELSRSNLSYANLSNADLAYANLEQAKLFGANLRNADLSHAELRGADLQYADLRGAILDSATLKTARFDGAIWIDGTPCTTASAGQCGLE